MKRTYFFPLTLSIYPILSILATNIEQIEVLDVFRSFVVSILLTLVVYILVYTAFRDCLWAAIFTSLLMFLFFSYGHFYSFIEDWTLLGFNIGRHRFLLGALLLILSYVAYGLRRQTPSLPKIE